MTLKDYEGLKSEYFFLQFVRDYLNFEPHDYQLSFLCGCLNYMRVLGLFARQTGKSTCVAMYSVFMAFVHKKKVLITSPSQRQSSELFKKIRDSVEASPLKNLVKTITQTEIEWVTGGRIIALPSGDTGATIRGFTADIVILEEAQGIKDQIVNTVIMPMLASTDGQIIKIGTGWSKNHFWHSRFKDETFKIYDFDWRVAVKEGQITQEFIDEQKEKCTSLEFSTEYENKFLEEADSYFPSELIESCVDEGIQDYSKRQGTKNRYYLGVDFARMGQDSSVFLVIEEDWQLGSLKVVAVAEQNHKKLTEAIGLIKMMHRAFQFERIVLDATGMGAGPTDLLKEELGDVVLEVYFTIKSKQDIYSNLKLMMEKGILKFPRHKRLIYEALDLRYEVSSSGNIKIHHSERGHDDVIDSLSLAVWPFGAESSYYKPVFFNK